MAQWKSDEELFVWIRKELSTPPVSDVMEQLGFRYPMLPAHIRPLRLMRAFIEYQNRA